MRLWRKDSLNTFKQYLDILLALLIMFVFSAMNLSQRQDVLLQAYLEEKARSFAENVRVHGYLSIQMYESFIKGLQIVYDVELIHVKQIYEPEYVNKAFTGEVMVYNEVRYMEEVLEAIYEKGILYMEKDDVFSVKIKNNTSSFGMLLFQSIVSSAYSHEVTQYGRIRDAVREGG